MSVSREEFDRLFECARTDHEYLLALGEEIDSFRKQVIALTGVTQTLLQIHDTKKAEQS